MSYPLVSVVTPFYNTAGYLQECIESVLEQDLSDFEYVLLDNRSTDGSTEIAESFARKDPRIRLIRADEFVAQLPNYNRALRHIAADSRYCKIVQADDWLYPRCLSMMVELAERHPGVGLVSSLRLKGDEIHNRDFPEGVSVLPGAEVARLQLVEQRFFFGSPTSVMYRSEVVRTSDPFFPEGSFHADTEACYEILSEWDFGFIPEVLTYSRVEEGSIVARRERHDPYHILDRLIALIRYAQRFLPVEEADVLEERRMAEYYDFLAKQAILLRGKEFWSYHRRGLATIGMRLEPGRVFRHALGQGARLFVRPHHTVRHLFRRSHRSE